MRNTLRIAELELNTLFYSPIAWFLLVVFIFQCGLVYSNITEEFIRSRDLQGSHPTGLSFLTFYTFSDPTGGLFSSILSKLFLYLPLLTMGLISREVSSGTIKLLYSSPVNITQIVIGKFIAMMSFNLLFILILLIFVTTGIATIGNVDIGLLLSGLLGIYLLLCAYAAIGLFMSCLSSYQVVAALSTFVVFALLNYVGLIWQNIDFVRDLTYFLSISGRVEKLMKGLINTKDVFYFLVIIFMFIGFSIAKLNDERESKPVWIKTQRYVMIILLALLIGFMTSIPVFTFYYDATSTKTETLTQNTQQILHQFKGEPIEITTYINLFDSDYYIGAPDQRNQDLARWEEYIRFEPGIKIKYVYYYKADPINNTLLKNNPGLNIDDIAKRYARIYNANLKNFTSYDSILKTVNLGPEGYRYVMQLKYKNKQTFLRVFRDGAIFPSEKEIATAFKRLTVKVPKIYFLQGELERSVSKAADKDYELSTTVKSYRYALVNQGFDLDTLSLENSDIPKDITALVIADPKVSFSKNVLIKINNYITNGGNIIIAGEPGKQAIINPLINPMGVQMMDGLLVQGNKDFAPDMISPSFTQATGKLTEEIAGYLKQGFKLQVSMPGVAGLTYNSASIYKIEPLLVTDRHSTWNNKAIRVIDSANLVYNPANGDQEGSFATALSLTRKINNKVQRIIITGDADFLSNGELKLAESRGTDNFDFNIALFGWFTNGLFPVNIPRPASTDTLLTLTDSGLGKLKIVYLGLLPVLLIAFSSILLVRRRRQ